MSTKQLKIDWKSLGSEARIPYEFWYSIYASPELIWFEIQKDENGLYKCLLKTSGRGKILEVASNPSSWETVFLTCRYLIVQQAYDRGISVTSVSERRGKLNRPEIEKFEELFKEPLNPGKHLLSELFGRPKIG